MNDRAKSILKFIKYFAVLFCLVLLQTVLFPRVEIINVKPDLIFAAIISLSLFEGPQTGALFALGGSIFMYSLGENGLTLLPLFYTSCALLSVTIFRQFDSRNRFPVFVLLSSALCACLQLLTLVQIIASWKSYSLPALLLNTLLPGFLYTFIISLVFYPLFFLLKGRAPK